MLINNLLISHTGGILPEPPQVPSAGVVCNGKGSQRKPVPFEIVPPTWLECSMPNNLQNWINVFCMNTYTHIVAILRKQRHRLENKFRYQMFLIGCWEINARELMKAWIVTQIYPTVNVRYNHLQLLQHRPPIDFQSEILEILTQVADSYNNIRTSNDYLLIMTKNCHRNKLA